MGQGRIRCLDGITYSMDISLSKLWEIVKYREAWRDVIHGVSKSQTRLSNCVNGSVLPSTSDQCC